MWDVLLAAFKLLIFNLPGCLVLRELGISVPGTLLRYIYNEFSAFDLLKSCKKWRKSNKYILRLLTVNEVVKEARITELRKEFEGTGILNV